MAKAKQATDRHSKLYPHLVLPAEAELYDDLNPDNYPPLEEPKDWSKLQCGFKHVTPEIVAQPWFQEAMRKENSFRDSYKNDAEAITSWQKDLLDACQKRQWCCIEAWQFAKPQGNAKKGKLNNAHNRAKMLAHSNSIILALVSFGHNPAAYRWYDYNKKRGIDQCMWVDYADMIEKLGLDFEDIKVVGAVTRWLNLFHELEPLDSRAGISRFDRLEVFGSKSYDREELEQIADNIYRNPEGDLAQVMATWLELKPMLKRCETEIVTTVNKKGKTSTKTVDVLPMRETLLLAALVLGTDIKSRKGAAMEFIEGIITGEVPRSQQSPVTHCRKNLLKYRANLDGRIDYRANGAQLLIITLAYMREYFDGYNNPNQSFKGNPIDESGDGITRFVEYDDYKGLIFAGRRWNKHLVGGVPRLSAGEDDYYRAKLIAMKQISRESSEQEADADAEAGTIGDPSFTTRALKANEDTSVEDVGFWKRVIAKLRAAEIETLGDLLEYEEAELYAVGGFKAAEVNHIKDVIGGFGMSLA